MVRTVWRFRVYCPADALAFNLSTISSLVSAFEGGIGKDEPEDEEAGALLSESTSTASSSSSSRASRPPRRRDQEAEGALSDEAAATDKMQAA